MTHYDLVIVGAGSGNMIAGEDFSHLRVAIVDQGPFGGTCLNRGCIPSKMFAHAGDLALHAAEGPRFDLRTSYDGVDWPAMRRRIMGRIDEDAEGGRDGQAEKDWVDVVVGRARFTAPRTLAVELADGGSAELTADQVVLATGTRPVVPPIEGLDDVDRARVHTSDSIMRMDALPASIAVVGGGYVGTEFADLFCSLGAEVLQIEAEERLLDTQDRDVADVFTAAARRRWDVRCGTRLEKVETPDGAEGGLRLHLDDGSTADVEALLLATGRRPNSDLLDLDAGGVAVDDHGVIEVDEHQRTSAAGVWALGDASTDRPLKHVANHEARVVRHNLLHAHAHAHAHDPARLATTDHRFVPQAVFTTPQVASVGPTEAQAREAGTDLVVGRQEYGATAHGWAFEEDDRNGPPSGHVVKLLADRATGLLVGAHLVGPQASVLIQPVLQAMAFDLPVVGLARAQYWIHPALTEVLEGALLDLERQLRD